MNPPPNGPFSTWYSKWVARTDDGWMEEYVEDHGMDWVDVLRWLDDHPETARVVRFKTSLSEQANNMFNAWLAREDFKHTKTPSRFIKLSKRANHRPFWESLDKNPDFWKALTTWDRPPSECAVCCAPLTSQNIHVMECGHSSTCRNCTMKMPCVTPVEPRSRTSRMKYVACPICRAKTFAPTIPAEHNGRHQFLGTWENQKECAHREDLLDCLSRSAAWTCNRVMEAVRAQKSPERLPIL